MGITTRDGKTRRAKWLLRLGIGVGIVLVLLLASEIFCRYYLGLGDPPLSVADPEIEYLFKPNQTCRRFGNLVHYNGYSMRSDDFQANKSDPHELRIMVFGDSVVNGGVQTPQSKVATSLLQERLASELKRKVIVGNISAGSWGPPNMLAYARRYGIFDADIVVIVLSSHDYGDAPSFKPVVGVDPNFPGERPWCALWEAITRYLPRYLGMDGSAVDPTAQAEPEPQKVQTCLAATRELIALAKARGATVAVELHRTREELGQSEVRGLQQLRETAESAGAYVVELEETMTAEQAQTLYRDHIHPNAQGQAWLAGRLMKLFQEPDLPSQRPR